MAPGVTATNTECRSSENDQRNVFEGPEKKLVIQFAEHAASPSTRHVQYGRRNITNGRPMCKLCPTQTLRRLRKDQITAILNAARCTMLSAVSNRSTDAYLLSESSMFVSDFRITIKTCGTTTLLSALPVILRIVFETLGLEVLYVMFSRVAYLFPKSQTYPHDCFDHEVSFLDHHLAIKGKVFEAASHTGSKWYLYFAGFRPTYQIRCGDSVGPRCLYSSPNSTLTTRNDLTLEIYMFDLDPLVMNRFMFHDRPHMIGSDNVRSGTNSYRVQTLLSGHDVIDGYNFAPCGYSMNALKDDAYYTIHVSPELTASYVSFETTVNVHSFSGLTAAVVKLFRPGRFTASRVLLGHQGNGRERMMSFSWGFVSRLLSPEYSLIRDPSAVTFEGTPRCFASVASFQKVNIWKAGVTPEQIVSKERNTITNLLLSIAVKHNARISETFELGESSNYGDDGEENYIPKYVVDLGRVARNWSMLHKMVSHKCLRLRYSVRSNPDKGVLALLNGLGVDFEVADAQEVDLLVNLGVSRSQVILVTPVLTASLVARFSLIGTVALFDVPVKAVQERLRETQVDIELRVVDDNGLQELHAIVGKLSKSSLIVASIAFESSPDSFYEVEGTDVERGELLGNIRCVTSSRFPGLRNDVALHFGQSWVSGEESAMSAGIPTLNDMLRESPMEGVVSIDASRALLNESISISARIVGRRGRRLGTDHGNSSSRVTAYSYYLSDGAYGALSYVLMSALERTTLIKTVSSQIHAVYPPETNPRSQVHSTPIHKPGAQQRKDGCGLATLYGPTCDALDWIWEGNLPLLQVGDSLLFRGLGAYSSSSRTPFNGFGRILDVSYVVAVADL